MKKRRVRMPGMQQCCRRSDDVLTLIQMPLCCAARAVDFLQNYTAPVDKSETYIRKLVRCRFDLQAALHPVRDHELTCHPASLQQDIANRQSRTLEISLDDIEEVCLPQLATGILEVAPRQPASDNCPLGSAACSKSQLLPRSIWTP